MIEGTKVEYEDFWIANKSIFEAVPVPESKVLLKAEAGLDLRRKWVALAAVHLLTWVYIDLDTAYRHPMPFAVTFAMGIATGWAIWLVWLTQHYLRNGFAVKLYEDRLELPHLASEITIDLVDITFAGQPFGGFGTPTYAVKVPKRMRVWLPNNLPGMHGLTEELNRRRVLGPSAPPPAPPVINPATYP